MKVLAVLSVLGLAVCLSGCEGVSFINANEEPCKQFYALAAKNPPATADEVEDRRNNVLRIKNWGARADDIAIKQATQSFYDAYISQNPSQILTATSRMLEVC
jgi:hypothetical protein